MVLGHSTQHPGGCKTEKMGLKNVIAVIAARDEETHLADTLDSLKNQTHPIHKIILINDGSQDDTPIIARKYGCVLVNLPYHEKSYLSMPQLPAIWNKGFEIADLHNPDFILISGADQIYPPNYIELLLEELQGNIAIASGEIAGHGKSVIPRGSGRLVKAAPWKKISGMRYVVSPGWESHMINVFALHGFQSKVVHDLVSIGRAQSMNPHKSLEEGRGMKAVGYHWFIATMRSLLLFTRYPKKGIQMLVGYYTYRGPELDCSDYVRAQKFMRLRRFLKSVF